MESNKPLILVSNDDGITSKGIKCLIELMKSLGEVVVVAPEGPQSGKGHAITIESPLRLTPIDIFDDVVAYKCSGTPADCVKLAKHHVLKDRQPDLVVSGINHGSNAAINILYSGTISAAIEAAIEGIPAIGFSVFDYDDDANFSHTKEYILKIAKQVLDKGLMHGTALNVNFPKWSKRPLKGVKICRQADARWKEEFDERTDPNGRKYFWLTGNFINQDKGEDTDEWAIANQFVSVVPCQFDMTAHHMISVLNGEWEM